MTFPNFAQEEEFLQLSSKGILSRVHTAQYLQMDPLFKVDTCHALQLWSKDSGDDVGGCVFYLFWSQRAFDFVHMLKKLMVVYGAVSKANSINHLNLNSVSKIGHHPYIGKGQKQ